MGSSADYGAKKANHWAEILLLLFYFCLPSYLVLMLSHIQGPPVGTIGLCERRAPCASKEKAIHHSRSAGFLFAAPEPLAT